MAENRFSKGVKAAKERTAELEANKKKQEQEVAQNKIEELPEEPTETKFDISKIFSDKPKKKKSVAKTFYMSATNMEKLEKLAKSQKMSVSKVLNEVLNNVLYMIKAIIYYMI